MNDFKENLKFNTNDVSKNEMEKRNSLPHKIKKAAMIGGLSLMAAISSVGCSKYDSKKTTEVTNQQVAETNTKTGLLENVKAKEDLKEDIQELIETIGSNSDAKLSDDESLKVENLLLKYVFIETSDNYDGNIPYASIIPQKSNSQLVGTFYINDDEKQHITNYNEYMARGLFLDADATELYNQYFSNALGTKSPFNALTTLYKIELTLTKGNKQLISILSYDELVNLMKSSYISAYNNMLSENDNYNSDQALKASEFVVYVAKENNDEYILNSYRIDDNGSPTLFESTSKPETVKIIDDYLDTYTAFYNTSFGLSHIETILSNLKIANEKNDVSEDEIIEQLTNISLNHEKLDAYYSTRPGLKKSASEVSEDGR